MTTPASTQSDHSTIKHQILQPNLSRLIKFIDICLKTDQDESKDLASLRRKNIIDHIKTEVRDHDTLYNDLCTGDTLDRLINTAEKLIRYSAKQNLAGYEGIRLSPMLLNNLGKITILVNYNSKDSEARVSTAVNIVESILPQLWKSDKYLPDRVLAMFSLNNQELTDCMIEFNKLCSFKSSLWSPLEYCIESEDFRNKLIQVRNSILRRSYVDIIMKNCTTSVINLGNIYSTINNITNLVISEMSYILVAINQYDKQRLQLKINNILTPIIDLEILIETIENSRVTEDMILMYQDNYRICSNMVISDADRTKTIQYSLETELKKLIYKEKREVNKVQIASLTTDLFTESSYDYSEQAMAFYAKIQPEEYDSYISILKKFTENKETNHQHYLATDDIVKCSLEKVKADRLSFWKKTEDK